MIAFLTKHNTCPIRLLFLLLLLLFAGKGWTQDSLQHRIVKNTSQAQALYRAPGQSHEFLYKEHFIPKTIVVKLKPEHENAFDDAYNYPDLHLILNHIGCTGKERLHKNAKKPLPDQRDHLNRPYVDITLTHKITYSENCSEDSVMAQLAKTQLFQYVERKRMYYPMYIPNDAWAQTDSLMNLFLRQMHAFEAWDIEKGDPSIIIGIVDTGMDLTHPELAGNYTNPFDLSDSDNDVFNAGSGHGTTVSSCSSAHTDNTTTVVGTGFMCRFMPLKASPDGASGILYGYDGLEYAVDNGCSVVNLSWGSTGTPLQSEQDDIDYAVINNNVVVVAAAGNTDAQLDFYPASYDHVISVAASDTFTLAGDTLTCKTDFGTYSYFVDVSAQGLYYVAASNGGGYVGATGSSFSAPIVAGLAGLLQSKYAGTLNALQISELIRITADVFDTLPKNLAYKEQLGKGRINMYRAVTENSIPAVRMTDKTIEGSYGESYFENDTIYASFDFINYLWPTSELYITLSSPNPNIIPIDDTLYFGAKNMLETFNNNSSPFSFKISPTAGSSEEVYIRIGFVDSTKNYFDYQYFKIIINPSYYDIDTNLVRLTITSEGRLGFEGNAELGSGFHFPDGNNLLFEAGLLMGTGSLQVSDCVREGLSGIPDQDFRSLQSIKLIQPPNIKDEEIRCIFDDSTAINPIGLSVEQRSYAWHDSPDDQYVIVEYQITNNNTVSIPVLHVGVFADWDIGVAYNKNRADYDYANKLGYVFNVPGQNSFAGISLLTEEDPICFNMDNGTVPGNNINPNSWNSNSKFTALSGGIARPQAGYISAGGFDVSQLIGGSIYNLGAGETRTIAFAFVGGNSLATIKAQAAAAKAKFISIKTSPSPVLNTTYDCSDNSYNLSITSTNCNLINFYNDITLGNPAHSGQPYDINNIIAKDTIYITGADSLYESVAIPYLIDPTLKATADFTYNPKNPSLYTASTVHFTSASTEADSLFWNFGDGSSSAGIATEISHTYYYKGSYKVKLIASSNAGCSDTITKTIQVDGYSGILAYPSPASTQITVQVFQNENSPFDLYIYNSIGELLMERKGLTSADLPLTLDIDSFSNGVYLIKAVSVSETLNTKFIKRP